MKLISGALQTALKSKRLVNDNGSPVIPKSWSQKTFLALILDAKKDA